MKTLLVGMNNPLSNLDAHALFPKPARSSGARILRFLQSRDPSIFPIDYLKAFDRTNVMTGKHFSLDEATKQFRSNVRKFDGRRVVVFSKLSIKAMNLPLTEVCEFVRTPETFPVSFEYTYVPHPSGLNRYYNSVKNRELVSEFLFEEYKRGISEC